ncbi:hypothetical protein [Streptomyces sp. NRRL F-5650]|nr:hypothetical protein [Streptomyces sp. NRRL F-5650]
MVDGRKGNEKRSAQAARSFFMGLLGRLVGAALSSWWSDRHGL